MLKVRRMNSLANLLKGKRGQTLLAIFPHPDDESFVAGGLFQLAKKLNLKTKLICIKSASSQKINTVRELELEKAGKILGIDEISIWKDKNWPNRLRKEIKIQEPGFILTFDPSGITGHPDHIVTSVEVLKLLKSMKTNTKLLWRVPDNVEKKHFIKNKSLKISGVPTHIYFLSFFESIRKLRAIYTHKSQMKNLTFKLQILEWYLFDHKEPYHLVELGKKPNHRVVFKK